jgi:hypothetical protein
MKLQQKVRGTSHNRKGLPKKTEPFKKLIAGSFQAITNRHGGLLLAIGWLKEKIGRKKGRVSKTEY